MKKLIIAGTVFFAGNTIYAQKAKTTATATNEISINAGVSSPSGNFAKGEYDNNKSGYSKAGVHLNLSGVHYFTPNLGINVLIGYTQFGSKGLQSLVEGYKEDSGTDSTTLSTTEKSSSFSVLVGPIYKIPVTDKFSVQIRALGGYTNSTLGGFKVYYEDYLDNTIMTQKKSTAGSFGLQAGLGLNYKITNKIAVLANADFFTSKPTFNISYENYNVNSGRKIDTYKENINGINATLGVGFSF